MKLNGSDIIAEVLIEHGVDTVFGYPGGAVLNIYDALYKYRDKIHHILTAHEQGASHAADGYARATAKPAWSLQQVVPARPIWSPVLPRRIWIPSRWSRLPATSARR